jgi:hypothetical protein
MLLNDDVSTDSITYSVEEDGKTVYQQIRWEMIMIGMKILSRVSDETRGFDW